MQNTVLIALMVIAFIAFIIWITVRSRQDEEDELTEYPIIGEPEDIDSFNGILETFEQEVSTESEVVSDDGNNLALITADELSVAVEKDLTSEVSSADAVVEAIEASARDEAISGDVLILPTVENTAPILPEKKIRTTPLAPAEVIAIRRSRAKWKDIAEEYNVTLETVQKIRRHITYTHFKYYYPHL